MKFRHRIPVLYAAHSVGRCVRSACAIPRFAPFVRPARHHAPRTPPPASPRCGDSSSVKTKKLQFGPQFCFLGFRSGLGQRGSGARGIDCRTGKKATLWGGPDGRYGIFRAALGDRFGRPVDRQGLVLRAPPPCFPCRCSMPAHCCYPRFHSILLWRGLPSWQNWSTLKKPVVQGVSLKELARVSALGD